MHQHLDAARCLLPQIGAEVVQGLAPFLLVGGIHVDEPGLAPEGGDILFHLVDQGEGRSAVEVDAEDVHTLGGQVPGAGGSEAATRTEDEGPAVLQAGGEVAHGNSLPAESRLFQPSNGRVPLAGV